MELAEGNRVEALKLFKDSLAIRRRIVELFGETPESLSGLLVGLCNLPQVDETHAFSLLSEGKEIWQRLSQRGWLTPHQQSWIDWINKALDDSTKDKDDGLSEN